jgi:hypothetical protein
MDQQLIDEIVEDQQGLDGDNETTRTRVIRIGRNLRKLQREQKKEQKAARVAGEEPQTWKEWCEEEKGLVKAFPAWTQVKEYSLIASYPGAYRVGMSVAEAYKQAGRWKKNGGNPPPKEKVTIKARPLITLQKAAGKVRAKLEKLNDAESLSDLAVEGNWTDGEVEGARREINDLRHDCNLFLKRIGQMEREVELAEGEVPSEMR